MNSLEKLLEFLKGGTWVLGFIVLAYALSQARRVTNEMFSRMEKFGDDDESKRLSAQKALFNFYIAFAVVIVFVAHYLDLIGKVLFAGLLLAMLLGLGIKITADALEKPKPPKNQTEQKPEQSKGTS